MSLSNTVSFHTFLFSTTKDTNKILPRGSWSLYKVYWSNETSGKTNQKNLPILLECSEFKQDWNSTTILFNRDTKSIDDPFGWNQNTGIDKQTKSFLQTALTQSKSI
jgi:hypothetical protein